MRVLLVLAAVAYAQPGGIEGDWQGTLTAGAAKLRLGLHISKNEKGQYSSKLDSIDQGAMGIPVSQTTLVGKTLHLEMPSLHAKYEGTFEGSEISGTFTQGAELELTFQRVAKIEKVNHPQNPKPPFPYESLEVAYENPAGAVHLAGTLTLPRGKGPFPAALMITGSGPQDRDESLLGHRPFLVIADSLTRRGIAVLRVDDRGVGKSTGNSARATLDDAASDVLAGVAYLKGRRDIDAKHIGVIGHSEGGIVGPLAASRSADIAFVVMLAGTGVTGEELLYKQAELIARSIGGTSEGIAQNREVQSKIFEILKSEPDETAAAAKMRALFTSLGVDSAVADAQIRQANVPEFRSLITYDPATTLRKLKIPVLALNGSRDIQVPPAQNLPPIKAALTAAGNPDFTVTELQGLNHLFQECTRCTIDEYGALEETFSPAALDILGEWLTRHTRP